MHELIFRANQLNFTKVRSTKDELKALFEDKNAKCEYITAYDKYGEYGIVGFYAVKDNTLRIFCFRAVRSVWGLSNIHMKKSVVRNLIL